MTKMNTEKFLQVAQIQRFCMHDGPGVRTTVFLKGCPLRCEWCHNPETQRVGSELLFYSNKCILCGLCESCPHKAHNFSDGHIIRREACTACGICAERCPARALELCGQKRSIDEIIAVFERDRAFYGEQGGVTISGGEPFFQGEAVVELLRECKGVGLSTAIETCGYADFSLIEKAIEYTDIFLWDIKDTDEARHRKYTGASNEMIISNLKKADSKGAKTRIRCILVNGVNACEEHYRSIGELALSLKNCEGVELIPYHAYAGTKSEFIGKSDSGKKEWIPTEEQLLLADSLLNEMNIHIV